MSIAFHSTGIPGASAIESLQREGFAGLPVAVVLGSGLGLSAPFVCEQRIPYAQIPGFPTASVAGHRGTLSRWTHPTHGAMLVMEGRPHLYEGWTMDEVVFPVRLLHALGTQVYVVTNAAGGLNPAYRVGEFIAIADHQSYLPVDLTIATGAEWQRWMELRGQSPYHHDTYSRMAQAWPARLGPLREGVYAAVLGPNYETPAEVRAFGALGADLVGMSTATEAMLAFHLGLRVVGLSLVSNSLAGPSAGPLTHLEVLDAGKSAALDLSEALDRVWPVLSTGL